ncbi:hypothetical protein M7I_7267 [Glarea lozoyensis 74030]|uniref:Uncharacterized protein n=1 Tax=Glarea lozoyensis (strain ATCC 74030 / MF5533) TaxID=1104152 RepID=H0EWU3_GLAL7|nr:hypothetical protein M7I_7267 [Glarea lozoyensis 74030]
MLVLCSYGTGMAWTSCAKPNLVPPDLACREPWLNVFASSKSCLSAAPLRKHTWPPLPGDIYDIPEIGVLCAGAPIVDQNSETGYTGMQIA